MNHTVLACIACLTLCGPTASAASEPGPAACPPLRPSAPAVSPLARSACLEVARLVRTEPAARRAAFALPQPSRGSWIGRHPALFGSMVGFGTGFLIGYLPGDDAVFYDFTATFNGLVLGGVGAGAGAIVGWAIGHDW